MTHYQILDELEDLICSGARIDVSNLIIRINPRNRSYDSAFIRDHLNTLLSHGADPAVIITHLRPEDLAAVMPKLRDAGADIGAIQERLTAQDQLQHLEWLLSQGASPDIEVIFAGLRQEDILRHLKTLRAHGIGDSMILAHLSPSETAAHLEALLDAGITVDLRELRDRLTPYDLLIYREELSRCGLECDIHDLIPLLHPDHITHHLEKLIGYGAEVKELIPHMYRSQIAGALPVLLRHGADPDELMDRMPSFSIGEQARALLDAGADRYALLGHMDSSDIASHLEGLSALGYSVDELCAGMTDVDIGTHFSRVRRLGASVNTAKLIASMNPDEKLLCLSELTAAGIPVDLHELIRALEPDKLPAAKDLLIRCGADPEEILSRYPEKQLARDLRWFLASGVPPSRIKSALSERCCQQLGLRNKALLLGFREDELARYPHLASPLLEKVRELR